MCNRSERLQALSPVLEGRGGSTVSFVVQHITRVNGCYLQEADPASICLRGSEATCRALRLF